jgi:hypothetical protein
MNGARASLMPKKREESLRKVICDVDAARDVAYKEL